MLKFAQFRRLALCAGLVVGACGDDGGTSATDTNTTEDTATVDDTAVADTVEDIAVSDTEAADVADTTEATQLPIGLVYVQSLGEGGASYHFDAPDDIYIGYSQAEGLGWELDSGAPIPLKKPFLDGVLDYENKRFTGTIDWSSDPWADRVRFEYDMRFSDDFLELTSGTIVFVFSNGSEETAQFGQDIEYRAKTDTDPYPFANVVSCLTRPLPLDDVVFVGVFEDAQCTVPTGTTFAFPLDESAGCCNPYNEANASYDAFSCASGDFSFDMAYNRCGATETISGTAHASADGCQPFQLLGNLYLRVMPGGACAD